MKIETNTHSVKFKLLILAFFITSAAYSQPEKDSLLKRDINVLVEEMQFMYGYDQALREYVNFKTFDRHKTDSIEHLPDSLKEIEVANRQSVTDSIRNMIFNNYINPKDSEHTKRLIAITKKYGFPSVARIKKYYNRSFDNPEFSPFLIFLHAPKAYWDEIMVLMKAELAEGRISRCAYGFLLWHTTGRQSYQPMLDNGFELVQKNGKTELIATCKE